MTNEELMKLIQQVQSGAAGSITTKIDKVIPLPVGSKTLIGFIGALVTGAFSAVSANPNLLDFSTSDWKSLVATLLALMFTALMGAGGISKWQRQVNVTQEAVDVLQQVLRKLQEASREG